MSEPTIPLYSRSSDIRNLALNNGCEASSLLSWLYRPPEPIWFPRGTAIHTGIEDTMRYGLDREGMMNVASTAFDTLTETAKTINLGKHTVETSQQDIVRQLGKWWDDVHPDSPRRNPTWDSYEWPAHLIEYDVALPDVGLYTQVDAVFKGKNDTPDAIVDWKSSSKPKADKEQLQIYAYGLRRMGLIEDTLPVGFFWFIDHSQPGWVDTYPGDDVVEWWIDETRSHKERIVEYGRPRYTQSWQCDYCAAQKICPINNPEGGMSHDQIALDIRSATLINQPTI